MSEKVQLGATKPTASSESVYDARLFNQSGGIASGFGSSDSYNVYDKKLFSNTQSIYRPTVAKDNGVQEFEKMIESRAHRGFQGTQESSGSGGPVVFEKSVEDDFGIDTFMSSSNRKRTVQGGSMHAASSGKREDYTATGSNRAPIQFQRKRARNEDE